MFCPKCKKEQTSSDSCIQCGVVFAKISSHQKNSQDPSKSKISGENSSSHLRSQADSPLFFESRWNPPAPYALEALSLLMALLMVLIASKGIFAPDSFILMIVHNINLAFHEAGHVIFGIFGNENLTILGGSLGQVLIPVVVAGSFFLKRDIAGFAFGLFWMGESLLDVALYMEDARLLQLELIGGLGMEAHDWRNLFNHWDLWRVDRQIVSITRWISWLGMLGACLWIVRKAKFKIS